MTTTTRTTSTTKTRNRRLSGHPARRAEQLEEADLSRAPRCECHHPERCPRQARFRVSELCAADGCGVAVSVHLGCADCKDSWVDHARECGHGHQLRVTPL